MVGTGDRAEWEYLTIPESERKQLNSLGRDGWDLVAIDRDAAGSELVLKRRLPHFREVVTLEQRRAYYDALGIDAETANRRAK